MDKAGLTAIAGDSRVSRAFGFVDLCAFTDYVDARGDEAAVIELRRLRSTVRDVAPQYGVRVDKWLGDGVMLVGVEVEPLVAAVVTIVEEFRKSGQLALRAGIAAGRVILLEGDDYVGRAVNLASRLCDQAGAGEVLAASEGLVVPPGLEIRQAIRMTVRGLEREVEVVTLAPSGSAGLLTGHLGDGDRRWA